MTAIMFSRLLGAWGGLPACAPVCNRRSIVNRTGGFEVRHDSTHPKDSTPEPEPPKNPSHFAKQPSDRVGAPSPRRVPRSPKAPYPSASHPTKGGPSVRRSPHRSEGYGRQNEPGGRSRAMSPNGSFGFRAQARKCLCEFRRVSGRSNRTSSHPPPRSTQRISHPVAAE